MFEIKICFGLMFYLLYILGSVHTLFLCCVFPLKSMKTHSIRHVRFKVVLKSKGFLHFYTKGSLC